MAVNIEVKIPMDKVTAKPLTGPEPIPNKINATINVVMLASKMVVNARSKPALIALCGGIPALSSSFILEKISTLASTAIPTVNTIPAKPGNVKVANGLIMAAIYATLKASAIFAAIPKIR